MGDYNDCGCNECVGKKKEVPLEITNKGKQKVKCIDCNRFEGIEYKMSCNLFAYHTYVDPITGEEHTQNHQADHWAKKDKTGVMMTVGKRDYECVHVFNAHYVLNWNGHCKYFLPKITIDK